MLKLDPNVESCLFPSFEPRDPHCSEAADEWPAEDTLAPRPEGGGNSIQKLILYAISPRPSKYAPKGGEIAYKI